MGKSDDDVLFAKTNILVRSFFPGKARKKDDWDLAWDETEKLQNEIDSTFKGTLTDSRCSIEEVGMDGLANVSCEFMIDKDAVPKFKSFMDKKNKKSFHSFEDFEIID